MTKQKTFKDKIERVNEITDIISSGKMTLEQILELYEEGINLVKELEDELKEAEKKVEIVIESK